MAITFRSQKGAPLTHDELDQNFREFFFSSSYIGPQKTPYGLNLFQSKSLNQPVAVYFPQAVGNNYYIQLKSGSNNISSSNLTGSANFQYNYDTDHFSVSGSSQFGGNVVVKGTVTAREFKSELVSSSIVYQSGSTKSGDTQDDIHEFTGSVKISGSLVGVETQISGSFTNLSQSLEGRMTDIEQGSVTLDVLWQTTGSLSASLAQGISGSIAELSQSAKDAYLLNSTDTFSGDLTVDGNIIVNGTGSFAVIQSVTGSAKIIGDAFVVVNNNTPIERYAGLSVYDSGSSAATASFFFDGENNNWKYEYTSASSIDYAVAMFGPEMSSKGDVVVPGNNLILKGTGTHHITSSIISDDGSTVTVGGDLTVAGTINATITGSINLAATASSVNFNNGLTTTSDVQFDSLGIGTAASGVTGEIRATGDITAYYSSDERLKDNITPLSDAINKINQIGGYEFDWNSNSSHSGHDVGVIAQEIQKVLPEVVTERDNGYLAVRYEKIVALLIQAIKEQQLQIEELKSKL